MHVPDGFIDLPTCAGAGAVAAGAIALSLRGARRELDDRAAPMAGLTAVFVFAAQMVNFPVAAGTSGHLVGATLAAVLVGPFTGALCLTVVLMVQALFFADGGLSALGVNVATMGVVAPAVGYGVFVALRALRSSHRGVLVVASAVGAFASVLAAAATFSGFYALGGTSSVPPGTVLAAMLGVHTLIGLGEAVITALVLSAVLTSRPDLVRGAQGLVRATAVPGARPAPATAGEVV